MAQRLRPKQITEQAVTTETSLAQVKNLLETGIGCVTFLRGLFGDENFIDSTVSAPRPISHSSLPPNPSQQHDKTKGVSSVKVKKLIKGISEGADKLIDCIQIGASDAIERGYLEQLMFAIYLDPSNPTCLSECYCFAFTYEADEQGNRRPELTVRDQLRGMDLSSSKSIPGKPKLVSENDAKRQVQKLIKALIVTTQSLDELPRRRFMNIRLYYNDSCPSNYEPPLFKAIDLEASRYNITTCDVNEVPDLNTLGRLSTGIHGVSLTMCSIASQVMMEAGEDKLTLEECLSLNQSKAEDRAVMYDAESLMRTGGHDASGMEVPIVPLGILDSVGSVISIESVRNDLDRIELAKKVKLVESDAEHFASSHPELVKKNASDFLQLKAATGIELEISSQDVVTQRDPVVSRVKTMIPPVPRFEESRDDYLKRLEGSQVTAGEMNEARKIDKGKGREVIEDSEMREVGGVKELAIRSGFPLMAPELLPLPAETQLLEYTQVVPALSDPFNDSLVDLDTQPIQTRTTPKLIPAPIPFTPAPKSKIPHVSVYPVPKKGVERDSDDTDDGIIECDCGGVEDDGGMVQCDGCDCWKHVVCYGYNNVDDVRLPESFKCYKCRGAQSDVDSNRSEQVERILQHLSGLALFRKALDLVQRDEGLTIKSMSKGLGVESDTAAQMIRRLKLEKFLIEENVAIKSRKSSLGGKSQSKPKPSHRTKIVINTSQEQRKIRQNTYFSPGRGAEVGFTDLLDCSEEDADGDVDSQPSAGPSISTGAQSATHHRIPAIAAITPASKATFHSDPLLVERSKPPSLYQPPKPVVRGSVPRPPIKPSRLATLEDPIESDSDSENAKLDEEESIVEESIRRISVTPAQARITGETSARLAEREIELGKVKKLVPSFGPKKGNGLKGKEDGFTKASMIKAVVPVEESMDIDPIESIEAFESHRVVSPLAGPSKRRSREEVEVEDGNDSGFGISFEVESSSREGERGRKRTKCSEVGEIEATE